MVIILLNNGLKAVLPNTKQFCRILKLIPNKIPTFNKCQRTIKLVHLKSK